MASRHMENRAGQAGDADGPGEGWHFSSLAHGHEAGDLDGEAREKLGITVVKHQ